MITLIVHHTTISYRESGCITGRIVSQPAIPFAYLAFQLKSQTAIRIKPLLGLLVSEMMISNRLSSWWITQLVDDEPCSTTQI